MRLECVRGGVQRVVSSAVVSSAVPRGEVASSGVAGTEGGQSVGVFCPTAAPTPESQPTLGRGRTAPSLVSALIERCGLRPHLLKDRVRRYDVLHGSAHECQVS